MKRLLRFTISSVFVTIFLLTGVQAQPPFDSPSGSVTMNGSYIFGLIPLPYVEENSTNYYSFWIHGDPAGQPGSPKVLTISSVNQMGSTDFSIDQNPSGTTLINYSDSALLKIKFIPTSLGEKSASFLIQNNGMTLIVGLKSSIAPGSVVWMDSTITSGSEINLGSGELNIPSVFSMSFKNRGTTSINMIYSLLSASTDFTLLEAPTNVSVNSGESATVKIQFNPNTIGEKMAQLTLLQDLYTYQFILKAVGTNTPTATLENVSSEWNVFPNPISDKVVIGGQAGIKLAYQLTDMSGKVIQKGTTMANGTISIPHVRNGLYHLQWRDSGKSFSRLISKQ